MATRTYSRTVPDGATTNSSDLDTELQSKGKDLDERLVQGGHKMATLTHAAAFEEADGKHCIGIEDQVDHTDAGYFTIWWNFAGSTYGARAYGQTHATKPGWIEANPDIGGGVPARWVGKNVTTGDDPGHGHTRVAPIPTTFVNNTGNAYEAALRWTKPAGTGAQTITRLDVRMRQAPGLNRTYSFFRVPGPLAVGSPITTGELLMGTVVVLAATYAATNIAPANNVLSDGDYITVRGFGGATSEDRPAVSVVITG